MSMRVATSTIYDLTSRAMGRQQTGINKSQAQISSGRRIQNPSDDPSGAARALDLRSSGQMLTQIQQNQNTAKNRLEQTEVATASAINLMQEVLESTTSANNESLTQADLRAIASTIRGSLQELAGIGNSTDSEGKYIFAGFSTDSKPFVEVGGVYQYQGDTGKREAQVGFQRKIQVNENGSAAFESALGGNGTFMTNTSASNAGTAVIRSATVQDHSQTTKSNYSITFSNTSGTMQYSIVDSDSGTPVATGTYKDGGAIEFDGIQITVGGSPSNGDSISVAPATERSVFAMIDELATALEQPIANSADKARLKNEIFRLQTDLQQGLDGLIDARSRIGSRLSEIDTFSEIITESMSVFERELSQVEDLDYATAVTKLSKQQTIFEAAQLSYMKMMGTNMFQLMN
jgi:flagellar hook-associated protein 3 FlgL